MEFLSKPDLVFVVLKPHKNLLLHSKIRTNIFLKQAFSSKLFLNFVIQPFPKIVLEDFKFEQMFIKTRWESNM